MINGVAQSRSPRRLAQAAPIGSGAMAIRCIVVDDHPAVRLGVRELLAIEPDFEVLEAHATAEAALAFARRANFDVAVVDYQLGSHSGLWLSRKLKRLPEPPAVVVYSAYSDYVLAAACVVAEVNALVSKAALGGQLCEQIRDAAHGGTHLPVVPPSLADSMRRRLDSQEQAIFGMMLAGISNVDIGHTLSLSQSELDARQWAMLRKLERLDAQR